MEQELISRGISKNLIYKDNAGFNTYASILRVYKVFGQKRFTIISQKFHNERAIFIANYIGLDTIGFNANPPIYSSYKILFREILSRIKVVLCVIYNAYSKYDKMSDIV